MLKRFNVNTNGTELEFISELITQLEACGLECLTDKDTLLTAMGNKANEVIPIQFKYGNLQFNLKRSSNFNTDASSYTFYLEYNGTQFFSYNITVATTLRDPTVIWERKTSGWVIASGNSLDIVFYDINNIFCFEVFLTYMNNAVYYSCSTNYNICAVQNSFLSVATNEIYTMVNTMPFIHNDFTKMLYISSKMFLCNSYYAATNNELLDCTNITPKTLITIDGKNYYALSQNTLIPIENE